MSEDLRDDELGLEGERQPPEAADSGESDASKALDDGVDTDAAAQADKAPPRPPLVENGIWPGNEVSEVDKLRFEFGWRWFDFHAKQRMQLFNFFLIITGVLATAYSFAFETGLPMLTGAVCLIGLVASIGFMSFDVRSRELTRHAEHVLEELEVRTLYPLPAEAQHVRELPEPDDDLAATQPDFFARTKEPGYRLVRKSDEKTPGARDEARGLPRGIFEAERFSGMRETLSETQSEETEQAEKPDDQVKAKDKGLKHFFSLWGERLLRALTILMAIVTLPIWAFVLIVWAAGEFYPEVKGFFSSRGRGKAIFKMKLWIRAVEGIVALIFYAGLLLSIVQLVRSGTTLERPKPAAPSVTISNVIPDTIKAVPLPIPAPDESREPVADEEGAQEPQ